MLAALFDIPPGQAGWETFQFQHAADHLEIIQAVRRIKSVSLFERVLYPLDIRDKKAVENWLELHQQAHSDFDSVLGIAGNDLTGVDFSKPNELKAWLFLNASEHQNARQALGI